MKQAMVDMHERIAGPSVRQALAQIVGSEEEVRLNTVCQI
jgi:hypothetical protein